MATLYTHAESNIFKTWLYMTAFLLFIIGLGWLFSYTMDNQAILIMAVVLSILMSFTSYWFSDKIVLAMSRARLIKKGDAPELYRLVENLCITAGLPLPKIYIIDEPQANAFATGRDAKHAVVAVSRGLLEKLERAELEGVLAHELSHIGNRDMLLSTVMVVLAGTIAILADFFLRIGFRGRRDRESGQLGAILMIVALALAILAPIFAAMMRLAVSRKREFLADASGALLTRYPEGLARALEKIAGDPNTLRVASDATAHLYIVNPFRGKEGVTWFHKLFMTHPPIDERIKALRQISI